MSDRWTLREFEALAQEIDRQRFTVRLPPTSDAVEDAADGATDDPMLTRAQACGVSERIDLEDRLSYALGATGKKSFDPENVARLRRQLALCRTRAPTAVGGHSLGASEDAWPILDSMRASLHSYQSTANGDCFFDSVLCSYLFGRSEEDIDALLAEGRPLTASDLRRAVQAEFVRQVPDEEAWANPKTREIYESPAKKHPSSYKAFREGILRPSCWAENWSILVVTQILDLGVMTLHVSPGHGVICKNLFRNMATVPVDADAGLYRHVIDYYPNFVIVSYSGSHYEPVYTVGADDRPLQALFDIESRHDNPVLHTVFSQDTCRAELSEEPFSRHAEAVAHVDLVDATPTPAPTLVPVVTVRMGMNDWTVPETVYHENLGTLESQTAFLRSLLEKLPSRDTAMCLEWMNRGRFLAETRHLPSFDPEKVPGLWGKFEACGQWQLFANTILVCDSAVATLMTMMKDLGAVLEPRRPCDTDALRRWILSTSTNYATVSVADDASDAGARSLSDHSVERIVSIVSPDDCMQREWGLRHEGATLALSVLASSAEEWEILREKARARHSALPWKGRRAADIDVLEKNYYWILSVRAVPLVIHDSVVRDFVRSELDGKSSFARLSASLRMRTTPSWTTLSALIENMMDASLKQPVSFFVAPGSPMRSKIPDKLRLVMDRFSASVNTLYGKDEDVS